MLKTVTRVEAMNHACMEKVVAVITITSSLHIRFIVVHRCVLHLSSQRLTSWYVNFDPAAISTF